MSLSLCFYNRFKSFFISHVYKIEWCIQMRCPVHGPLICFSFDIFRSAQIMVIRIHSSRFPKVLYVEIDKIRIFRVNIDHCSKFFCTQHQSYKRSIIDHHIFFLVHKKTLKTCNAFFYSGLHLIYDASAIEIRDAAVHRIICTCILFKYRLLRIHEIHYRAAFMLHRIIEYRSHAAAYRCSRS